MTKDNLEELLEVAFEMEGLITLMLKREDMTPEKVKNMLRRKAARFNELLGAESLEAPTPKLDVEVKAEDTVVPETKIVEKEDSEPIASVYEKIDLPASPVNEIAEAQEEQEIADSAEMEQEEDAEPTSETEDDFVADTLVSKNDTEGEAEVLNDFLCKKNPAFTLNDKFRFRRSLFDNSDEEFQGTLKIISEMKAMDEVEDYLYNDLCLDPENEDVKAFVEIISVQFA